MGNKEKDRFDPTLSTMSLGDHLEELRTRLILALLGLLIGTILCFFFGKKIILFIEEPYNSIMARQFTDAFVDPNTAHQSTLFGLFCADLIATLQDDPNAPNINPDTVKYVQSVYIKTLRNVGERTITGTGRPLLDSAVSRYRLQTLAPADAFVSYMKISLISGLILTSPWVFYQIWMFVAAGLYEQERKYVQTAIPFSVILFVTGALFFLFGVAPISLEFLLTFGNMIGVSCSWTFQKYVSFVTMLMFVFGIAFQTPIAIYILNRTGLVSIEALKAARKYIMLGIFIVAAVVTPPEVISQITLAIPLFILYEIGIHISALANRKQNSKSETK